METSNKWLELTSEEQVKYINTVEAQFQLASAAIEKDWWVTMVLKALFSMPFANYLSLKRLVCFMKNLQMKQALSGLTECPGIFMI
jgi:hypothetical protein